MSCYICCISTPTGIPIMCKKQGEISNLPFPVQAALNGAFVFGKSFDVHLQNVETDTHIVAWKDFQESVTVLVVCDRSPGGAWRVHQLQRAVWETMVLCVGVEDLANTANVERVKRQLKGCYRLVERLLEGLDGCSDTFCDLTGLPDTLLLPPSSKLQMALEQVTEAADSTYGCLLIGGRLAAATRNWHLLTPREQCLLMLYVTTSRGTAARDVSIYLPVKSPRVPFRLLICRLSDASDVVVLCGPTPSLEDLEQEAVRCWAPVLEALRNQEIALPRAFPTSVTVDPALLSFLLVSSTSGRCVCSSSPHLGSSERHLLQQDQKTLPEAHRRLQEDPALRVRRLRAFYQLATAQLMGPPVAETEPPDEASPSPPASATSLRAQEAYVAAEDHHCYALQSAGYTIYALFRHNTPPHVMRGLSQATLQQLTSIKHVKF